ncbi:MAG: hypothetical protein HQK54_05400, partial [Oligoflexales bacterium]|nr:hypothetical protein [Oligoflexales bacterium]
DQDAGRSDFFSQFVKVWEISKSGVAEYAGIDRFRSYLLDYYLNALPLLDFPRRHYRITMKLWEDNPHDFRLSVLGHIIQEKLKGQIDVNLLRSLRESVSEVNGKFFTMALMQLDSEFYLRSLHDHLYRQLSDEQKKVCLIGATHAVCQVHGEAAGQKGKRILKAFAAQYFSENSFVIRSIKEQKPMEGPLLLFGVLIEASRGKDAIFLSREQYQVLLGALSHLSKTINRMSPANDLLTPHFFSAIMRPDGQDVSNDSLAALLECKLDLNMRKNLASAICLQVDKGRLKLNTLQNLKKSLFELENEVRSKEFSFHMKPFRQSVARHGREKRKYRDMLPNTLGVFEEELR